MVVFVDKNWKVKLKNLNLDYVADFRANLPNSLATAFLSENAGLSGSRKSHYLFNSIKVRYSAFLAGDMQSISQNTLSTGYVMHLTS